MSGQRNLEAVEALRQLECQFAGKYPWLRRPRAIADRAYRQSRWVPIPSSTVAEMLLAGNKRLIRSGQDAAEGIVAAIEATAFDELRHPV